MRLVVSAPGKVNLALYLGGSRPDRRHELVTLIESLSLADELTLTVRSGDPAGSDEVVCAGVDGPNLALDALAALRAAGWEAPPVQVEIVKRVPVAAGMGGGSADAAAALRLAAAVAPLPSGLDIHAVAARLGADVPSQLQPGLSLGTGTGEVIRPAPPLPAHELVIVPSQVALSTAAVYREADRLGLGRPEAELQELRRLLDAAFDDAPGDGWLPDEMVVNDLEPAAISLCPSIAAVLDAVRAAGADHVLVCGSGPTVAGIFWDRHTRADGRAGEAVRSLAAAHPGAVAATPVQAGFAAVRRVT